MKAIVVAIALLGTASGARAQGVTPSQMALQIDNAVNGLAHKDFAV